MKDKGYSLLLVGLVLILATSVVACNQPATITQSPTVPIESPTEPTAIQPTPRTITLPGPSLTIPLKAGERVEVEVAISTTGSTVRTFRILTTLTDPFGNIIGKSASRTVSSEEAARQLPGLPYPKLRAGEEVNTQKYPWRFAFIAATDGDYMLVSAHACTLKAVIFTTREIAQPTFEPPTTPPPVEKTEEKPTIDTLPFTYTGKGNGITTTFKLLDTGVRLVLFKLNYMGTWDGDIIIGFWRDKSNTADIVLSRKVESGVTYEWIFNEDDKISINNYYLSIGNAPSDGEWTITVSREGFAVPMPEQVLPSPVKEVDITVVVEYEGDWKGGLKGVSGIVTSGNKSLTWENIELPVEYTAQKTDGGASPLTVKIIYEGQVVTEKTVVDQDEVHAVWLGPN